MDSEHVSGAPALPLRHVRGPWCAAVLLSFHPRAHGSAHGWRSTCPLYLPWVGGDTQPVGRGGGSAVFVSGGSGHGTVDSGNVSCAPALPQSHVWWSLVCRGAVVLSSQGPRQRAGLAVDMQPVGRGGGSAVLLSGNGAKGTAGDVLYASELV